MRKLASIRRIDSLSMIEGADKIELAHTGGWQCVVGKGQFKEGDLAVFFEIDSALPADCEHYAFLKERCYKKWANSKGDIIDHCIRIKTARFKGNISQGLFLPIETFYEELHLDTEDYPEAGVDVTDALGVRHYDEIAENAALILGKATLGGDAIGNFPSYLLPKTDEERLQNLTEYFTDPVISKMDFEVTEKFDGSSISFIYSPTAFSENPFHVCSRNRDLKESEDNVFWKAANLYDIGIKLKLYYENTGIELGIQGELVGPGLNGNRDMYTEISVFVFRIRDLTNQRWLTPYERFNLCSLFGIPHVKVMRRSWAVFTDLTSMEAFLEFVKGKTDRGHEREGMVWKSMDGRVSFKVINNEYLLKQKE